MKEYGGYIEMETFRGEEFHACALSLNSGRHCVEYLIKARKITKLYIPYFLCDSVQGICEKLNVNYEYYDIEEDFSPKCKCYLENSEFIYVVNYYGQISNEKIQKLQIRYGNIIIDNVQAFFQKPVKDIDTLYSCRKFFGVPDGAYLYTNIKIEEHLEYDVSYDRMKFLLGRFEKTAEEFYDLYVENNNIFIKEPLKKMSRLTKNLLRGIDYTYVIKSRNKNYEFIHKELGHLNQLKVNVPYGPFMYPLYVTQGENLKKYLIQQKIYIPTLWPEVMLFADSNTVSYRYAKNIVPLPVDQRYDLQDMEHIIEIIHQFYTDEKIP